MMDAELINSFKIQDNLNSKVWEKDGKSYIIKSEVRKKLLETSNIFIDSLGVDVIITDIIMIGSLVNYNWSKYSDIDLHIVVNFNQFSENTKDLYLEFFDLKKIIFNQKHNINMFGYDVECFVQDENTEAFSSGVYSVLFDKWENKPKKENIKIDVHQIDNAVCTSGFVTIIGHENRDFKNEIEFEKDKYSVKFNKTRAIKIFAKVPDVVSSSTEAKVLNSNQDNIKVLGKLVFEPYEKTNYAIGILNIKGENISKSNKFTIQINGKLCSNYIDVVPKEEEEEDKSQFKIDIVPRDFGKTARYQWNTENKNHLMIAGEHPQIKRYLGSKTDLYPGQNTTVFKCLLAEILSESMVIKRMTLNSRYDPSNYENILKTGSVEEIINKFTYRIEDEKLIFLLPIHEMLVKDSLIKEEIRRATPHIN